MTKSPSSTSLAESADSPLGLKQPDLFGPSPSASKNLSVKPSSESTGPTRQSSTTSAPSRQMDLEELTSSSAVSLANLGVRPGSKEARKMTVTSGRKWLALLQSYGHAGLLAKMSEALLTNQWGSSAAFLTWRASAIAPSHLLFQLAPSMPPTDATASGLLHTPTAAANQMAPSMKERDPGSWWPTPTTSEAKSDTHNVQNRVDKNKQVMLCHAVRLWPTPVAQDYKGQGMSRERRETREPDNLCSWTAKHEGSGALNPEWVEWLMGFPAGWTSLTPQELQAVSKTERRGSRLSEMPSSRKSSRKSAKPFSQRSTRDEC